MPVYNRKCKYCDWDTDFALEPVGQKKKACPQCGKDTERYMAGHSPMMIPDTFPQPLVDNVMTAKTQVFYSRTEQKDAMRANGLQFKDQHVPPPGSDQSAVTSRWDAISKHQMDGAIAMLTRAK
jgi:hypothetical protein